MRSWFVFQRKHCSQRFFLLGFAFWENKMAPPAQLIDQLTTTSSLKKWSCWHRSRPEEADRSFRITMWMTSKWATRRVLSTSQLVLVQSAHICNKNTPRQDASESSLVISSLRYFRWWSKGRKKGENSPSKSQVVASYKVGPCYKWTDMGPPISKVISPTSFFQVTFWWFKLRSLKRSRKPSQKNWSLGRT